MRENEFEKQVHEKMEGLTFQPTEAVWAEVESKLRKRKKRRYLFIWLPVFIAALFLGGYSLWPRYAPGRGDQNLQPVAENTSPLNHHLSAKAHHDNPEPTEKNVQGTNSVEAGLIPNADTDAGNTYLKKRSGSTAISGGGYKLKNQVEKRRLQKGSNYTGKRNRIPVKEFSGFEEPVLQATPGEVQSTETGVINKARAYVNESMPVQETSNQYTHEVMYSSVNPELLRRGAVNTELALGSFSQKSQVALTRLKHKYRWQFGFALEAGRSAINNGELNSLFRAAEPSAMFNYSAPAANMYFPPSALKQGPAFSPGIYLKKQLNSRLALTIGLNYVLYTSSYQVGQKADSIIIPQTYLADQRQFAGVFRSGSSVKYINRYHFVELPVALRTKLSGRRETGLYWDAGVSVSRMVATNALFHDSRSGLYYKDNGLFNKTQWNLLTGLPVNFFSSKKVSLLAGPQFQYGFTKLSSDKNRATHLSFIGLKASILLK